MILKRSLIFSLLFFCAGFLFAQEIESVESSSEEINAASDGSVGNEAAEEKSNDREVEISRDIGVSFNIGSIVTYDNERMHDFHSQWFGWYPEFLIFLGLDLPSGIQDMNLTISGLNIGKFENSMTITAIFGRSRKKNELPGWIMSKPVTIGLLPIGGLIG